MHPQLAVIADELVAATSSATALTEALDESRFHARPDPSRWSVAECLQHLNLSSALFLPLLDTALARGRETGLDDRRRYRRDFIGWFLCWALGPPAWQRLRDHPSFP